MGKTLFKKRLVTKLRTLLKEDDDYDEEDSDEDCDDGEDDDSAVTDERKQSLHVTVPLNEKQVKCHTVAATLLQRLPPSQASSVRLIHLDIAYEVLSTLKTLKQIQSNVTL